MQIRKTLFSVLLLLVCLCAKGQRQIKLLDSDTRKPIKNVTVKVDKEKVAYSNAQGFVSIPLSFDTIRFSHVKYSPEMLLQAEVRDTMVLFPIEHMLPEVTVSELAPEIKGMIKGWVAQAAAQGAMNAPKGIASFDFAELIDFRKRRDKKHLKKAKEALSKWDKKKVESEK